MAEFESGSIVAVPKPDGSTEWWQLTSSWNILRTEPLQAAANHTHTTFAAMSFTGDVHFTEKVFAGAGDANQGINKIVTIPDVCILTFKKGLLVDFEVIVPP
jgi:hypothetical protein